MTLPELQKEKERIERIVIEYNHADGKPHYFVIFIKREKVSDIPPRYSIQRYRRELTDSEYNEFLLNRIIF